MPKIRTPLKLAATIKGRRLALGMSQNELAERAHVSRKWISELEHGKPRAPFNLIMAVLDVLDLELFIEQVDAKGRS